VSPSFAAESMTANPVDVLSPRNMAEPPNSAGMNPAAVTLPGTSFAPDLPAVSERDVVTGIKGCSC
jgi:hypothetical protein